MNKREIKTSGDFKNDPKGALRALDKTNVAVFLISKSWFDDVRAQKEWRHAVDLGKPLIYIFDKTKKYDVENKFLLKMPNLVGTINHYGDMKKTSILLDAMVSTAENIQRMQ